jgi:hypothetical protein
MTIDKEGRFVAVDERGSDNFHHSIYEEGYDGLLVCRTNQNGQHPWQTRVILEGLNGKNIAAERDALRELLREARQWISEDDLMAADEPDTWGSLLARIDAALKGDENE